MKGHRSPEDCEQQAGICRLLLYHLNAPLAEGCRLRGVVPAPGAVRIAVHAGDDETGRTFLYRATRTAISSWT